MFTWAALQLAAMLAAFVWFLRRSRDLPRARLCMLVGYAGAAVGSIVLGPILALPAWVASGLSSTFPWRGQVMSYGALGGLVLAYGACARRRGIALGTALDRLAPTLGVQVAIARIGCFVAGCDFGVVTEKPWGVRFAPGSPAFILHAETGLIPVSASTSLPVHPTQLYESAVGLLMIGAALLPQKRHGVAFARAAVCYAVGRFVVELFRGDPGRGQLGPLSTPAWLSLVVLVAAALYWPRSASPGE
jgi:prolipoprotein diacylglyceryltransferase